MTGARRPPSVKTRRARANRRVRALVGPALSRLCQPGGHAGQKAMSAAGPAALGRARTRRETYFLTPLSARSSAASMMSKPSAISLLGDGQRRVGVDAVPAQHRVQAVVAAVLGDRPSSRRTCRCRAPSARTASRERTRSIMPNRPMLRTAPTDGCLRHQALVVARASPRPSRRRARSARPPRRPRSWPAPRRSPSGASCRSGRRRRPCR